jgi:membrane protein implicated in regulation of membrane protease activity
MDNKVLRFIIDLLSNIIFLAIIAILISVGIIKDPDTSTSLLVATISIVVLLLIYLGTKWIKQSYNNTFENENSATNAIKKRILMFDSYENLRICGTSCTSIFSLFDAYVEAMVNGKSIFVCI